MAEQYKKPIIFSTHPRTKKKIKEENKKISAVNTADTTNKDQNILMENFSYKVSVGLPYIILTILVLLVFVLRNKNWKIKI